VHQFPLELPQPFDIRPRGAIQIPARTDEYISHITYDFTSSEILNRDMPLRSAIVPATFSDLVGQFDEAIGAVFLRRAFEIGLDFAGWGV
jgi:hypothetical protein